MTVEANIAAVRRFVVEVLDGGNAALLGELFTAGGVRHFPGRDMTITLAGGPPRNYTAFHTDIHHLFGQGDYVTIRLTHHVTFGPRARFATRLGTFDAGAKSVVWDASVVFRFEGDKMAEEWVNRDELHILMQLGVVSAPASV